MPKGKRETLICPGCARVKLVQDPTGATYTCEGKGCGFRMMVLPRVATPPFRQRLRVMFASVAKKGFAK